MTTKKKATHSKKPASTPQHRARTIAERSRDRIAKMTPAQLDAEIAECDRVLDQYAPTLKSARSDLLKAIQVLILEFVKKYYPSATHAQLSLSGDNTDGRRDWSAAIAIPVPKKE